MTAEHPAQVDKRRIHGDQVPSTFLERGVAVAFTTPALSGARVRPHERAGLELIVPNPSGNRGSYILPLQGIEDFCQLTVQDRLLRAEVSSVRVITPHSIRRATRGIAGRGLAGRDVAAAMQAAECADEHERLLMNFNLLLEFVRLVERPGLEPVAVEHASAAEVERRGRAAAAAFAPSLQCEPRDIHAALEGLAEDFSRLGRGPDADKARVPRTLARLGALRQALAPLLEAKDETVAAQVALILEVIDVTVVLSRSTLADARKHGADVLAMMRARMTNEAAVSRVLARPEWLLDGWDHICALWETTRQAERRDRIPEIVALLPLLPREAAGWISEGVDVDGLTRRSRMVDLNVDWRSATPVFDQIAQNERVLALAA